MTESFEATLARIHDRKSVFEGLDERAVEIGVLLPLLRQVGWDTEDVTEIYPQRLLSNGGRVDYDLQIDGDSRVVIEVKRWNHVLNGGDEDQLKGYCSVANPRLAVLTNGNKWHLYVEPWKRLKDGNLHRFLEFDIFDEPGEVEESFRQFLACENLLEKQAADRSVREAKKFFNDRQNKAAKEQRMVEVLTQLAANPGALANFLAENAETDHESAKEFLESKGHFEVKVANDVKPPPRSLVKPLSFTFKAESKRFEEQVKKHSWKELTIRVCEIMHELQSDTFNKVVLEMPKWFSPSDSDPKKTIKVGETGVYMGWGSAKDFEEVSRAVVAKMGYPGSLTIELKKS